MQTNKTTIRKQKELEKGEKNYRKQDHLDTLVLIKTSPLERDEFDSWGWHNRMVFTLFMRQNVWHLCYKTLWRGIMSLPESIHELFLKYGTRMAELWRKQDLTFQPLQIISQGSDANDLQVNSLPQQCVTAMKDITFILFKFSESDYLLLYLKMG